MRLKSALASCQRGQAVELALGTDGSLNSFLIDPIAIPAGVSLIVDGGVTVYGSRDPANYQDNSSLTNPQNVQCGTYGEFPALVGCKALLTFDCDSGVYGYGVLDGQGNGILLSGPMPTSCPGGI
jgi:polygalacturonase